MSWVSPLSCLCDVICIVHTSVFVVSFFPSLRQRTRTSRQLRSVNTRVCPLCSLVEVVDVVCSSFVVNFGFPSRRQQVLFGRLSWVKPSSSLVCSVNEKRVSVLIETNIPACGKALFILCKARVSLCLQVDVRHTRILPRGRLSVVVYEVTAILRVAAHFPSSGQRVVLQLNLVVFSERINSLSLVHSCRQVDRRGTPR